MLTCLEDKNLHNDSIFVVVFVIFLYSKNKTKYHQIRHHHHHILLISNLFYINLCLFPKQNKTLNNKFEMKNKNKKMVTLLISLIPLIVKREKKLRFFFNSLVVVIFFHCLVCLGRFPIFFHCFFKKSTRILVLSRKKKQNVNAKRNKSR